MAGDQSIWSDPQAPTPALDDQPARLPTAAPSIWSDQPDPLATSMTQARPQNPDQAARILELRAKTGLPAAVIERNLEDVEAKAAAADFDAAAFRKSHAGLAAWLAEPANAAIAHDDLEPLGTLSTLLQSIKRVPTNAMRALAAGPSQFNVGAWGTAQAAAEWLGADDLAGWFAKARASAGLDAAYARGDQAGAGAMEKAFYSGFESLGGMAPGMLLTAMTGGASAAPMLSTMGMQTGGAAFGEARDQGVGLLQSTVFGAQQSAVEVLTELIPAKWFLEDLAKNAPFMKILGYQLAAEVPGEQVATLLQDFNEWAVLHPERPFQDYLDERPSAAAQTLIATITAVGVQTSLGKAAMSLAGENGRARQAELDKQFLDDLAAGVKGSATVERKPDAAQALLGELTQDGPVAHVYAPVDTFATYWQDKGLDLPTGRVEGPEAVAAALTGRADALAEAIRTGVDLEIPTAAYAVQLAGTEHHAFFAEELRLGSPERMNARELVAFREAELAKAEEAPVEEAAPAVDPVRAEILAKLQTAIAGTKIKLPAGALEGYADVFEALTATFEREGLDPVETLKRYGILVAGPQESTPAAPAKRPFKEVIAEMKAKRDAHVSEVEAIFAAEGGVKSTLPNGVQHLIHPSTQEPGKIQLTSFTPEGVPSGHMVFATVAEAAASTQGDTLAKPEPVATPTAQEPVGATTAADPAEAEARNAALRAEAQASGPAYLDPVAIAAGRALAARVRVGKRAEPGIDTAADQAQTEGATNAEAEPVPSRVADRGRSPARHRIAASEPGGSTRRGQEKSRIKHVERLYAAVLAAAQDLDPVVDEAALREEFDLRLDVYLDQRKLYAESENSPRDLLREIAKRGGLFEDDNGQGLHAELKDIGAGAPFGALAGVRGVFAAKKVATSANERSRGHGVDVMLQMLQGDPRFAWLESVEMLLDQLDEASRHGIGGFSATQLPGTEELRDVGIKQEAAWWQDPWIAPSEDVDESTPEGDAAGDTFDVATLEQLETLFQDNPDIEPAATYLGEQEDGLGGSVSLYNIVAGPRGGSTVTEQTLVDLGIPVPAKAPAVDVLDTGEAQPRLFDEPVAAGRAAELGDVPFRLTAQVAETPAAKKLQRTLFQGVIESTEGPAPKFYSRILRTVMLSPQTRATGAQWVATIKNSKLGVNMDEFALTSVADLEAGQVYTKQEVINYLSVHEAQVSEVVFDGDGSNSEAEAAARREWVDERAQAIYDEAVQAAMDNIEVDYDAVAATVIEMEDGTWGYKLDGDDVGDYFATEDEAADAGEAAAVAENERRRDDAEENARDAVEDSVSWRQAEREAEDEWDKDAHDRRDVLGVKFPEYQLDPTPGFDEGSYREAFVTAIGGQYLKGSAADRERLNALADREEAARQAVRDHDQMMRQLENPAPEEVNRLNKESIALRDQRDELVRQTTAAAQYVTPTSWEDGHDQYSDVVNPIVRLRFNTRFAAQAQTPEVTAPLRAEAVRVEQERTEAIRALSALSAEIGGGVATPEQLAEVKRLRFVREVAAERVRALDKEIEGPRVKVMFLEEMQPPSPDNQASMPPIYLKNWREIGFKWALRYAADHGYGAVAWTTGKQQQERYPGIRREVDSITWETATSAVEPQGPRVPHKNVWIKVKTGGTIFLSVDLDTGRVVRTEHGAANWNKKLLSDVIGKEPTQKVMGGETGELREDGLEVGQGLARLYDVDFVNVVNKLPAVKANGGRVAGFDIGARRPLTVESIPEVRLIEAAEWRVFRTLDGRFDLGGRNETIGAYPTREAAQEAIEESALALNVGTSSYGVMDAKRGEYVNLPAKWTVLNVNVVLGKFDTKAEAEAFRAEQERSITPPLQPGLELTPKLKEAVLGGQTLFQGEKNLIIQHNVTAANLRHAASLGGLPVPSLAIVKADDALTNFGEITLVGHKEMADPRGYARTRVFAADIYSPRYPQVLYKFDDQARAALRQAFAGGFSATNSEIDVDELERRGSSELSSSPAAMWTFLNSHNITPKIVMNKGIGRARVAELKAAGFSKWFPTKEQKAGAYYDWQQVSRDEEFQNLAVARERAQIEAAGLGDMTEVYETATSIRRLAATVAQELAEVGRPATVNRGATRDALRVQINKAKLDNEFDAFIDQTFARLAPKERIFAGFTNAGNRRYIPHTLENVVKILKKDLRGGESSGNIYGVGQLRASFTQQFRSVKQITEARDRIVDDQAFEAVKEEIEHEFFEVVDSLKAYYSHGDTGRLTDTVMAVMQDGATKGLDFALRDYGFADVPDDVRKGVRAFMGKLRTLPTEYFEAKILREVDLAEFAGAVVSQHTPPDVLELLRSRGIEIAVYQQDDDRKAVTAAFAKKLGDKVLFQEEEPPAGKRGSITGPFDRNAFFGPDLQFTIKLFEGADVSTFLHESAHLFLKIMQDLESRPEATEGLKRDLAIIRGRFGPDGVEQHELFARSFEAYLLEGKAPSLALRKLFADFRTWLMRLYRTMANLNVNLTDDVRGVFDRMLATDAAIAEAQAAVNATPMFTTPESARMSAEEFDVYKAAIAEAGTTARETLEAKLLRDLQRQQRASYREEKQAIREQVQAEVYAMPVYQALAAMKKGTHPDGTPLVEGVPLEPLKLSREIIVDRYGPERLAALPSYPPPIHTAAGGMDPDTVATLFGFASGDALLTAVAQAHPMRGLIEAETTKRMTAQAGDLMVDEKLTDLARAAVANEHRAAIVQIEMATLNRLRRTAQAGAVKERDYERRWFEAEAKLRIAIAEGRKQVEIDALDAEVQTLKALARGGAARINAALPSEAELREVARARIGRTRVRDLRPDVFHAAARRAGQQALEGAARQDFAAAIAAKQQEAISLALYREATKALADVEARVRAAVVLDTPASRKRIGLAGGDYQAQIDAVLERYQFAKISGKALTKREALRAWVASLEADGFAVDLPEDVLDDARRIHFRELTVDELAGVSDGLKMIVQFARLKNRLLKNKDIRDFKAMRDKLVASIRANNAANPLPLEFRSAEDRRLSIKEWFASHARLSTLAQVLDGPGDGGAMWTAIARPINEAADVKGDRNASAGLAYGQIIRRHYPGRELAKWADKLEIKAIGASLSKEARMAVALNWGNETSRDRLLNDPHRKWSKKQIEAILDTLDERDWQFVVDTWRFLDQFWPEIAAKTKRLTGVEPERVEGVPVVTKFGTFDGGYYPLAADTRLNVRARQHEVATEAKLKTAAAYVQTTTRRGHLETRKAHAKYSVRLDLGVMFGHLEQVIHDLTHHEMLIDVTRLLRDPAVSQAILDTRGPAIYEQFTRALEAVAAGKLPRASNGMEKAATYARTGTQIALLGYNLWTGFLQPLGIFNGAERVGAKWVARGLGRWLKDASTMQNTTVWIDSVSPFMSRRSSTATQDLADLRGQLGTEGGWFDGMVRGITGHRLTRQHILDSFLWHIGLMQRVADVPTWLGQFEKSMAAGETEDRAIALADQAVIDAQGSGRLSDLAEVQRGGPVARLFLTFYSYGSATFNATYRRAGQTNFKKPSQVTAFLGGLSLIYIFPSMATVALAQMVGRSGDGDDEDWLAAYMADVGRETLASALNGMVWVREGSQAASDALVTVAGGEPRPGGVRGYAGPAGTRLIQLLDRLAGEVKQGEVDEGLLKALNQVGGILFRYPAAQVQRTIDGWAALEAGETENPAALLFGPPRE